MSILYVAAGGTAVVALRLLSRVLRRQNTNENQDDHFFADDDYGSSLHGIYQSREAGCSGASRSTTSVRSSRRGSCDYEKEKPANKQQQPLTDITGTNAAGEACSRVDGEVTLEANDGPSGGQLTFRSSSEARRRAASVQKVHEWDDAGGSAHWIPVGTEGQEHSGSSGGGSSSTDERNRALLVSGPHSASTSPSSSIHRQPAAPTSAPSTSQRPLPPSQLQWSTTPDASKTSKLQATMTSSSSPNALSADQPSLTDHEPTGCGTGSSMLVNCSHGSCGRDASLPCERSSGTGTATLVSGTGTLTCSSSPNTSQCTEVAEQRSESDSEQGPSGSQGEAKKKDRGKTGVQASSAASVALEVLATGKADQVAMLAVGSGRMTSGVGTRTTSLATSARVHKELPLALRAPAPPVAEPAPLPPTILPTRAPDPDRIHAMQMQVETLRLQHLQRQAAALLITPATNHTTPLLASVSAPISTASGVSTSGVTAGSGKGSSSSWSPYDRTPPPMRSVASANATGSLKMAARQGATASQGPVGGDVQSSTMLPNAVPSTCHDVTRQSTSLGSWLLLDTQPVQQPQTANLPGSDVSGVPASNDNSGGMYRSTAVATPAVVGGGQQFQEQQQLWHAAQQLVGESSGQLHHVTWPSMGASGIPTQLQAQLQQAQEQHLPLQPQHQLQHNVRHTSPPLTQMLPASPSATTQQPQWPDAAIQAARLGTLQRTSPPQPAPQPYLAASPQQRQQQQGVSNDPAIHTATTSLAVMATHVGWAANNGTQPGASASADHQPGSRSQPPPQPQSHARLSPEVEAVIAAAAAGAGLRSSPPPTPAASSHYQPLNHSVNSQKALGQKGHWQQTQQQQHRMHESPSSSPTQAHLHGRTSTGSTPSFSSLPGGEALLASPPSFRHHLQDSESVKRTQDWINNTPMRREATESAPALGHELVQGQIQALLQTSMSNGGTGEAGWRASEAEGEPSPPLELRPHPPSFTNASMAMGLVMAGSGGLRTGLSGVQVGQQPRLQASPSSRYGSPVMLREDSPGRFNSKRRSTTDASSHGSRHTSTHGSHRHRSSARRAREQQAIVQQKLIHQDTRPQSPLAQYSAQLMNEAVGKAAPVLRLPNGGAFFVPLKHEIRMELSLGRPNSTGDALSRQSTSAGIGAAKAPSSSAEPMAWGRRQ